MTRTIAVAGATGSLGTRIVHALLARDAKVQAIVRPTSKARDVEALRRAGARIVVLDDGSAWTRDLVGTACVVSTLAGLRDAIVDGQSTLLAGALRAGVPRFIASDFSADFTTLLAGENRNLALHREFQERLDGSGIHATSILNGMFSDILQMPQSPFFDFEARRVDYWGSPDQLLDFTTMGDTAEFTANAALDDDAPRFLRIAGDQIDARGMAAAASEATGDSFALCRLGTLDELALRIVDARKSDPTAERNAYAPFQLMQYLHNMFSGRAKLGVVDNGRYGDRRWTRVEDLLETRHEQAA